MNDIPSFKMPTLNDKLGVPNQITLEMLGPEHVAFVKIIKSRIISKNAQKIVDWSTIIRQKEPNMQISLICTSNICSKSVKLLADHQIEILIDEEGA